MASIRVTEVLAALSLTTDLATGMPFEKGLAVCLLANAVAEQVGLDESGRRIVFHAALLGAVGCTSRASENAESYADDIAFQQAYHTLDPGDPGVFAAQMSSFGQWAPQQQAAMRERFITNAPKGAPIAVRSVCEVSRALGPRLGLPEAAVVALTEVKERWDGLGAPDRLRGDQLSLTGRILHLAEQAVLAFRTRDRGAALSELRRRAGGHLDPELVAVFAADPDAVWGVLDENDLLTAVVSAEPGLPTIIRPEDRDQLCAAMAVVVDLKGRYLLGHSAHVAQLADAAAELAGMNRTDRATLRAAALLHDIGRAGISSSIWDRPGPLGAGDWERVRLHSYWTDRVLRRCPSLTDLAEIAAGHHERLDGSGYHRGVRVHDLSPSARILAAADVFAAMTEERPHRPAHKPSEAAAQLSAEAAAGRLDRDACSAVVEAAGLRKPRTEYPCGLTEREVDVLRLAARGLSNRQIAAELVLSERTVGHHLAHIYDKTGRRTRAGAAVFAMEYGLLPG
ncbi:HD domain-containing phosphohydrolase [Nocardia huaxiensis]|uniref:HD domain-containing protein n=1 Tax=Nocardia huaxiensis TaxID=2755382 RepID=A0A7D6ZD71_9NOCA|nr:HD domain-containing phosphohydrolase [Nocardia huaxiensis]QLY32668.1 HD domain-containing protein [Nocardia huaxiensis]UFS93598.1 HD domain-containing protein [Nocardia huaxiensis]